MVEWKKLESFKLYVNNILPVLLKKIENGITVYPKDPMRAFRDMDPDKVRVVLIAQDPYFNGRATGLKII